MKNDIQQGENISWGASACDTSRADDIGARYRKALAIVESYKSMYNEEELYASEWTKDLLETFYRKVDIFAKARNLADIDISAEYGICVLDSYLRFIDRKSYMYAFVHTADKLNKFKTFQKSFSGIKLPDNQILFLICNNKTIKNELRDFIGNLVITGTSEGIDLKKRLSNMQLNYLYKYIAVKLKEQYSLDTGSIYKLPSLTMKLSDLISDPALNSSAGGKHLQPNIICDSIEFSYNDEHRFLSMQRQNLPLDRSSILRQPLIDLMQFVVDSDIARLGSITPRLFTTDNEDLAYNTAKTENCSCKVIEQYVKEIGNKEYTLANTGTAKSSLLCISEILSAIGVDDAQLNFVSTI